MTRGGSLPAFDNFTRDSLETLSQTFSVQASSPVAAVKLPSLEVRPRTLQTCVAPKFREELQNRGLTSGSLFLLWLCSVAGGVRLTGPRPDKSSRGA